VVLTGAGISVPSGLKDYRSKDGLYAATHDVRPEVMLSRPFYNRRPYDFYDYVWNYLHAAEVTPNAAHELLATWHKRGIVRAVITQNIDGLHEQTGVPTIPFHGSLHTVRCDNCDKTVRLQTLYARRDEPDYLECDICGEIYNTNVVLYGDAGVYFSGEGLKRVVAELRAADLVLIVGTSLKVYPFANLPEYASPSCPVWIVNAVDEGFSLPYDRLIVGDVVDVFEGWEKEMNG
ncbi:MAG: Sir2 family NAD-dependent protein deacetylase, partial [Bacilli bacterium]